MPLLWLSTAFLAGIWLGSVNTIPKPVLFVIFILCAVLTVLETRFTARVHLLQSWRKVSPLPLAVLLAALALGAWRYPVQTTFFSPDHIASQNDRGGITFSAVVTSLPTSNGKTTSFKADVVPEGTGIAPSTGRIQVQTRPGTEIRYGDLLRITGEPQTPPAEETFSYREYLARQGIQTLVAFPKIEVMSHGHGNPLIAALYSLRLRGYTVINQILPQPQAALLNGILLGLDQDLPEDLTSAFQQTGTAHIIAISGFNIAIVSAFVFWALRLFTSRWKAAIFSIIAVFLYSLLVGMEPAVMRAAIMGAMAILGMQIGRRGSGLNTLVFTAAVMCLFNPYLLWDVSFQLSFAATLGLIVLGNPLLRWFAAWVEKRMSAGRARGIAEPVGEYVLLTLAAQIATLPLMAWHFHQISFSAILANPLILPAQPLVMMLGAAAMVGGMIYLPLGSLLGWFALVPLTYTISIVEAFSDLGGSLKVSESGFVWIVIMLALAAGLYFLAKRFPAQAKPAILLTICGIAALAAWMEAASRPDGRLHILLPGLDNSHAVLILTPRGQSYLINGAASGRELTARVDARLSPFERRLDGLILTDAQASPLAGLPFLAEQVQVNNVLWGRAVPANSATRSLESTLRQDGAKSSVLEAGQTYQLEPGLVLRVLASGKSGTALIIDYGNFTLLVPGGITPQELHEPLRRSPPTLLILDESNLVDASPQDWIPFSSLAILWNESRAPVPLKDWISTGEYGQVELTTDGVTMTLGNYK
jgi:competence protein ComEC